MKKIIVNEDNCIGCGACVAIDDKHFDFNEDGKSKVISQDNLEDNNLANAIESCPVAAISISEESTCTCGDDCTCGDNCECGDDCKCHEEIEEACAGCCAGCNGCEE